MSEKLEKSDRSETAAAAEVGDASNTSERVNLGRHVLAPGSAVVRESLDGYGYSALVEILDTLRIQHSAANHRHELLAYAESFLGSSEHAAVLAGSLSPRLSSALAATPFRAGNVTLRALKVRLAALGDSPTSLVAELRDLLLHGAIIFTDRPRKQEMINIQERFVGSERLDRLAIATFPAVLALVAPHASLPPGLHWRAEMPARVQCADFHALQREMYLSLRAVLENRLRVTAHGLPFKHDVARIPAQPSPQTTGTRVKSRRPTPVEPSPRVWFALSCLFASPAIDLATSHAVATSAGRELLASPLHVQAQVLFDAYRESVFSEFFRLGQVVTDYNTNSDSAWVDPTVTAFGVSDVPTWPRLKTARAAILAALADGAREGGEWIAIPALETAIRADEPSFLISRQSAANNTYWGGRRDARYYEGIRRPSVGYPECLLKRGQHWDEVEGAYVRQVLAEPLHWLGLLDLGFGGADGSSLVAVRLTALGRHLLLGEPAPATAGIDASLPTLVVQPNFDVVVLDAAANLDLVSRLDDFAERTSLDRAATYRLTRESAVRGFEGGLTSEQIVTLLERSSSTPLPQNVGYSIAEWARQFERVHVRRAATLLVADSEAQLSGWLSDPDLGPCLGPRLSPIAVLVPTAQSAQVQQLVGQKRQRLRTFDYSLPLKRVLALRDPGVIELNPKAAEPYLRYRVAAFADPDGSAPVGDGVVYRITADSIRRALANGLTADPIVAFLHFTTIGPPPPDTLLRIRGWGGAFGPVRQSAVVAIELSPGLNWSTLAVVPEVERGLVRVASPTIGLFDPSLIDSVRSALRERGIELRDGLGPAEPQPALARRSSDGRGIDHVLGDSGDAGGPLDLSDIEAIVARTILKTLREGALEQKG